MDEKKKHLFDFNFMQNDVQRSTFEVKCTDQDTPPVDSIRNNRNGRNLQFHIFPSLPTTITFHSMPSDSVWNHWNLNWKLDPKFTILFCGGEAKSKIVSLTSDVNVGWFPATSRTNWLRSSLMPLVALLFLSNGPANYSTFHTYVWILFIPTIEFYRRT